jgi:hypothetical protein
MTQHQSHLLNDGADNPRALANGCRRTLGTDEHVAELHKVHDLSIDRGEVPCRQKR